MAKIAFDYPMGVKREVVSAFKPMFGSDYPDPNYASKIHFSLDWPTEQTQYPAIFVTYTEGPIENVGVGHREWITDDFGIPVEYRHYKFTGQLNFNILGLSPLERDEVAAGLVNLLAFHEVLDPFKNLEPELNDQDFAGIILNTERITPQGTNESPVPWGNADEQIFAATYSVPLYGEFMSDPSTGNLIIVSGVEVYPYRPEQGPPW